MTLGIALLCLIAAPPATMREVPAGRQWLGSPATEADRETDEGPQLELEIGRFAIDRTPVTVAAFTAQLDAIKKLDDQARWWDEASTPSNWLGKCNLGSKRLDHPVNCVEWRAARAFCRLRGADLPTEAEWERVARSGKQTEIVNSIRCQKRGCRGATASVTTRGPRCNTLGVCDVFGNVWEWTRSDYREVLDRSVATSTTTEPPQRPVLRGGAWLNHLPKIFRAAHRGLAYPEHGLTGVGFRCVDRR